MCCSSIFWLKVWDGAQPDERVWTLATAGRAGGDRPATAPRIASHAHHPRSRIPDTPPANSTGPPRVHATMRRQNRTGHSCRRRTGIRATPRVPVTLRAGGVGAHGPPHPGRQDRVLRFAQRPRGWRATRLYYGWSLELEMDGASATVGSVLC